MNKNKHILIKNIYYMLAYAFKVLNQKNFEEIEIEEFEQIHNLFAAILYKGISAQLKQGLYREYISRTENLKTLRGKLDIYGSLQNNIQKKHSLVCEFDEFSENNIFNQILKTTSLLLIRENRVSKENREALKSVMIFFGEVDELEVDKIMWNKLIFHKSNQNYKMLLNICNYVISGLILSTQKGKHKMANFLDEQRMYALFESFVREYYKKHHSGLSVSSPQIPWDIEEGIESFLPVMQTDIVLKSKNKKLIIDTKYYSKSWQTHSQYNKSTLRSNNLYQIFTYVKNEDINNLGDISGLLLYAKTDEEISPNSEYVIGGNKIYIRTLDLNREFSYIAKQLDDIVDEWKSYACIS
ncbi:5-methylcytosine-specific restriction endonuclease system specificity protein McrC [Microaceticoccus formicicus]|uniref:5-methylcytosine-specific restriction endonuclease system specificity protein McrC n=1 Tax=Microaceticoccus formicicus TaxID=3118105 RepID=UPI003CD04A6D|nr:5-methylcytosine-specific restriction endonuclease system specificity protein McrC [Peptoniphilaceae bacterium AMB_02]